LPVPSLIGRILPSGVAAAEVFDDAAEASLFPEETAVIAEAVDKRRREFASGRLCARRALAELGMPDVPVPRGVRGAPRWPPGVVGSITHCAGYRAAAVAPADHVVAIGIDAEPCETLPSGVLDAVSLPAERTRLRGLSERAPGHWDRLLFSAKESVYKAWFPLTGRWLGFEDADVTIDPDGGVFVAQLLVPGPRLPDGPLTCMAGRWVVHDGVVATAIALTAGGQQRDAQRSSLDPS
jgi:4'-phosphopantetheinyl transferase EntD